MIKLKGEGVMKQLSPELQKLANEHYQNNKSTSNNSLIYSTEYYNRLFAIMKQEYGKEN